MHLLLRTVSDESDFGPRRKKREPGLVCPTVPVALIKMIRGRQPAFSARRICVTVDDLGELTEAGVTSLKIEGRMKSAEYGRGRNANLSKVFGLLCEEWEVSSIGRGPTRFDAGV